MQQSSFNVRVPLPDTGDVFLMNTFSDAQAIVPPEIVALLDRIEELDGASLTRDERDAIVDLAENGFVVADRSTERQALEAHFRELRESTDLLRVTVLTTLQCNFACDYCYQGDHGDWNKFAEKMSLETAARLADWIETRLDEVRPKQFTLMFFGGEPLLNLPVMYYLAERASRATGTRRVPMTISIVTNGLLLTREIVERLLPYGLSAIKVTLDGDRDTHNRMRPLRGGQGTFDKIVHNVRQVAGLCAISIGGNFDASSADSYPALLDFLRSEDFASKIAKVAFKPVIAGTQRGQRRGGGNGIIPLTSVDPEGKPLNGTCMTVAGAAATSACDACHLADEQMSWLREETKRRGFPTVDGVHMGPCEIHREHAYTVGPDGSLYACPGFTGDKGQSVGHIDGRDDVARALARTAFDRLSAWKECRDCAFIPVCAGGCSAAAHVELGNMNQPNCHKRSFEEGVASLAREAAASLLTPALAS